MPKEKDNTYPCVAVSCVGCGCGTSVPLFGERVLVL